MTRYRLADWVPPHDVRWTREDVKVDDGPWMTHAEYRDRFMVPIGEPEESA